MNDNLNKKVKDFLLEESSNLDRIDFELRAFNPFEVLNVEEYELRHSNFISWLLNPLGSHASDDYVLKRFIMELDQIPDNKKIKLQIKDLSKTRVYRERDNVDILLVNHEEQFVICIENKINAGRSGNNQLIRYAEIVGLEWSEKGYDTFFVFLTKHQQLLSDEEINLGYENITYDSLVGIISNLLLDIPSLDSKVKDFIGFYIENYKRNFMNDENELSQLALEIYKKHKEAIDFIVSKKPVIHSSKNFKYVKDKIENHEKYSLLSPKEKGLVRFLPKDIENVFTNPEFNSWRDNNVFFAIEFFLFEESLDVKFCFGAVNNEEKFDELQSIKEDYFNKMLNFKCFKRKPNNRAKSTSKYPGIVWITLLKITSSDFVTSENFEEAFDKTFDIFEQNILNDWIQEVKKVIAV
ncbi:PD-(D/E)XK nuclease family protein [Lutibacter holmesii]|uniref:PD-(D/E)XK nuclease family protein n=1 Tax=Lutibacter holmesii TaxID=1137985 RepID=A0ABW3WJL4_9FLAO